MVLANQPLHIHGAPTHLLPVYVADQRLVARIFLAHAASLRYMIFFARHKFGRFLHSFMPTMRPMKPDQRTDWLLFSPKLELATTGTEPGLHHGDLLLIGNHLRISGES